MQPTGAGVQPTGTTAEQRAHWRALAEAATRFAPFPWSPGPGENDGLVRSAGGLVIIDCKGHEARTEYVALACQLVPALLDDIERLEAVAEAACAVVDEGPGSLVPATYFARRMALKEVLASLDRAGERGE